MKYIRQRFVELSNIFSIFEVDYKADYQQLVKTISTLQIKTSYKYSDMLLYFEILLQEFYTYSPHLKQL